MLAATAIGLIGASAAHAEEAADAEVSEITVTARYRTESVQKVPIGITTLIRRSAVPRCRG